MAIRILQGATEIANNSYFEFDTEANVLGEGGMGRVYLGKYVTATGAELPIAVKVIYEGVSEKMIERARREASIQIRHDSIVYMYGFIETSEKDLLGGEVSHYHVISEYLDGISLSDFIIGKLEDRDGVIQPAIAELYRNYTINRYVVSTNIIKLILSGIMALHDAGYIHRDIDPSNIMVTSDGKIKLIDFGIAKQMDWLNTADTQLTSSGQFLGKAGYASPELVLGDVRNQNYSTDVYAIGILYYQLITGHLPFDGTAYEMMEAQLHKKMPLGKIKSPQVRSIIKKATQKKQADRYASSAQFRAAIDMMNPNARGIDMKLLIAGSVAVVVLFAIIIALIAHSRPKPVIYSPTPEELFADYLDKLDSNNPDSVIEGVKGMETLAKTNEYVPAMFELAKTYMWAPNDKEAIKRKLLLGISVNSQGLPTDISKLELSADWLRRTVAASDSTHYQAMYTLASYYLNGNAVAKNIEIAQSLFIKAKEQSTLAGDTAFSTKINKGLNHINNLKKTNEKELD